MKNRMLPLGYEIVNGEITTNENEAKIVRSIFADYCSGSSLRVLVNKLNAQEAVFKENGVQWNKGRIYHILVDRRYIGEKSFPQIIDLNIFNIANAMKSDKGGSKRSVSKDIKYLKGKVICGKCGAPFHRFYDNDKKERWMCSNNCKFGRRPMDDSILQAIQDITDKVIKSPNLLAYPSVDVGYRQTTEIMRLSNEIARMNEQITPSFKTGKTLLFQLASSKFSACKEDKSIYTEYVLEQIKEMKERGKIDVEFMRNAINKVLVVGKNEYAVLFVNGVAVTNKEDNADASEIGNED